MVSMIVITPIIEIMSEEGFCPNGMRDERAPPLPARARMLSFVESSYTDRSRWKTNIH